MIRKYVLILALTFFIPACGSLSRQQPVEPARQETVSTISASPVKSDKTYLVENGVSINERRLQDNLEVFYPEIEGLLDKAIQEKINAEIKNTVAAYTGVLSAPGTANGGGKTGRTPEMQHGGYNVHGNYNNILSVCHYFHVVDSVNHKTWVKAYVYDLNTGNRLKLKDLFVKDADYQGLVNSAITERIIRENLDESSLVRPFPGITGSEEFFINESELVICFNPDNGWFYSHDFSNEFRIPFHKLGGFIEVYDRYAAPGKKLYTAERLKRKWLPNDLEIVNKRLGDSGKGYTTEANYFEFRGLSDKAFEEKLNRKMEERAREFINDDRFIKEAAAVQLKEGGPMPVKTRHTERAANFAGKVCIVERDVEFIPGRDHVFRLSSYCYDIKNGREFSFKEVLAGMPGCHKTILGEVNRQLREMGHGKANLENYEALAQKGLFYYDEYMIHVIFNKGTLIENESFFASIDVALLGEDFYQALE
ncbi:MAG: RsiV family protein [Bacillota bacterium]